MALKRQHETLSMFSMASMTDIIFLLLIFFMVTSTFVFPSAMEVNLPQSSQQTSIKPTSRIFIDKDMKIFAAQGDSITQGDLKELGEDQLEGFMQAVKNSDPSQYIALHADTDVPYGKIVNILDLGSQVGIKVVLATRPTDGNKTMQVAPETNTEAAAAQEPATVEGAPSGATAEAQTVTASPQ